MMREDADTLLRYLYEKSSSAVESKALAAELKEKFDWSESDTYQLLSMLKGRKSLEDPQYEYVAGMPGESHVRTHKILSFSGLSAKGREDARALINEK